MHIIRSRSVIVGAVVLSTKEKKGDHGVVVGAAVCWSRLLVEVGLQKFMLSSYIRNSRIALKISVEINPLGTLLHKPLGLFMRWQQWYIKIIFFIFKKLLLIAAYQNYLKIYKKIILSKKYLNFLKTWFQQCSRTLALDEMEKYR